MGTVAEMDNGVFDDLPVPAERRREEPQPQAVVPSTERLLSASEASGLSATPAARDAARFVDADARIHALGSPPPRLINATLRLVDGVKAAARNAANGILGKGDADAALRHALPRMEPGTAGPARHADAMRSAASAGERMGRALVQSAILNVRSERRALAGSAKFVTEGAMVHGVGAPSSPAPIFALAGRLASIGLVSAISIIIPDGEAHARGRHGNGNGMAIVAGIGAAIVGGVVVDRMTNGGISRTLGIGGQGGYGAGNGYGGYGMPRGGYNSYPREQGYGNAGYAPVYQRPQVGYPLQGQAYGGGYAGHSPIQPSNDFIKGAKVLVASQVGNIHAADRIIDQALMNGIECVRRMGPGANCSLNTNGVAMDFGRGEFVAGHRGIPVIVETHGHANVTRPDILRGAFVDALRMKEAEMSGRYAPGY